MPAVWAAGCCFCFFCFDPQKKIMRNSEFGIVVRLSIRYAAKPLDMCFALDMRYAQVFLGEGEKGADTKGPANNCVTPGRSEKRVVAMLDKGEGRTRLLDMFCSAKLDRLFCNAICAVALDMRYAQVFLGEGVEGGRYKARR